MAYDPFFEQLLNLALAEDIGGGDITTLSTIPKGTEKVAYVRAKEDLVLAGTEAFVRTFQKVDPSVRVDVLVEDGANIENQMHVIELAGNAHSLLVGERVALNFLMRLSGIATLTATMAAELKGTRCHVVDTRKTTPGWRNLEKAAVRAGGGVNHRGGLFDGVLIKDNHIAAAGSITAAVAGARKRAHHLLKIEVETTNLDEVGEALAARANVIMLDNMDNALTRAAVEKIRGFEHSDHHFVTIEASGNMVLSRLAEVAACGVDIISMGALTHSARSADLSMKIKK